MMTKKKAVKKIVLFMGDHARHVCPVIRVIAPAKMAGLEVFQGNERIKSKFKLHLDRIADADLIVLQRDFPADLDAYERVVQEARDSGKQIIYDIDDLLIDLPEDHPDTARYIPGRFPVLRAIAEADAVTVASETLKSHLQDFNPNIHVLPNYLLDDVWGKIQLPHTDEPGEGGPLTIGYMGGHSHQPDLDMVEPVLRRILDRYGDGIRLQFWGIEPSSGLAGDPRVSAAHLQYADYDQFSDYFSQQGGDIFIAPLKDSPFNRSKSWLKYLEYSALGVPGVYSDLEPYRDIVQHGKSGYLASTLDEWYEHLTALIEDPSLRKKIGEKVFKGVRKNYMLSDHAHQWKELFARVAADREMEIGRAYLENSLGLASRWQGESDADRARKEEELISAREEAQALSGTIHAQQEELARIQKGFDDLAVQHDEVNKVVAHFEKFAAEQSQKIEEIASQLAESRRLNQLIPEMQLLLKEKDQLLGDLHTRLGDKDSRIADQQSRLQSKDSLIADQEARLAAHEAERTQQEDRRVRLQAESSVTKASRFLRFTFKLRHRWSYYWMSVLRKLGRRRMLPLFDSEWYLSQWPDVAQAGVDPYIHYLLSGWREGRNPSPYFDVIWYLRAYPDVLEAGVEPLGHYIHHGRWENRRPHPGLPKDHFPMHQSIWLPKQHRPDSREGAAGGWKRKIAFRWKLFRMRRALRTKRLDIPSLFNAEWYLQQGPDVASSKIHPYLHYLTQGWMEGRDPHPNFNVRRYLENNPDVRDAGIEPFDHFCTYGWLEGRNPRPEIGTTAFMLGHRRDPFVGLASILSIADGQLPASAVSSPPSQDVGATIQVKADRWESAQDLESVFARRETSSIDEPEELILLDSPLVKLIAFYLPQFHPIPENDEFWGEGFTEWTNVTKARPLFEGHYQPRIPGDLGFYDLRLVEVMQRQAEMAKAHGIYGFCFHHYWFNGKRVLERPVDQFLEHPEINMPFCLNWANENWTRRWDGFDEDVLLRQDHSTEDDIAFIADAMHYFNDPRYILVENKPLFILYNPQRLPDPQATVGRWQTACCEAGFDGIFLVAAQTFGFFDPGPIEFDAAVEFPPHNAFTRDDITERITFNSDFKGFVADYRQLSENYPMDKTGYTLFKTVVPAWDNTARRGLNASVYHGSTPDAYMGWLRQAIRTTLDNNPPDQRFVFLNAWNEWAEGTYLEPDRDYGYAYLNATTRALQTACSTRPKILFIGHDAFRAGSQIVLLNVLRWLKDHTHFDIRLVLGRGGDLLEDYQSIAPTLILDKIRDESQEIISTEIKRFCGEDVSLIYTNTGVSGWILPYLDDIDAPVLTHVHELQNSIEKFVSEEVFDLSKAATDRFIAVSAPVKENLIRRHTIDEARIELVHPFIKDRSQGDDKRLARDHLGLRRDLPLIFGCGTLDWRKGPDLFLDVAVELSRRGHESFHFYWIGKISDAFPDFEDDIRRLGLESLVTYLGEKEDPQVYFNAGDIFLLPSREDPYPLVVLEAAQARLPTICFSEAGGIPDFIGEGDERCGFVVPYEDVTAMADAVERLLEDVELRIQMGRRAEAKFLARHTVDATMPHILKIIRETADLKPGVSVIVPTFNHASYLPQRLDSIFNQTYRDVEVLILDDSSTDGTVDILAQYASRPEVTIEINEENSGSTFAQWAKGIESSRADIIWIAEDDDTCKPAFLETLLKYFDDPDVKLAYAQSYAIDEEGEKLFSYKGYTDDISPERWEKPYVADAEVEVNLALAVKNTIPNASGVLFRRFDTAQWMKDWTKTNLAGDWALYLFAIQEGRIAFHPEHLNFHRRHENTNIFRTQFDLKRFEEYASVHRIALDQYQLEESTQRKMENAAYTIWKEVFPEKSKDEFHFQYRSIAGRISSSSPTTSHASDLNIKAKDLPRSELVSGKVPAQMIQAQTAIITTIPRSGTLMLDIFFKMFDYFLGAEDVSILTKPEIFSNFDQSNYPNIPFKAFLVAHGYCPGYREFGHGPIKQAWESIPDSPDWFNAAGEWVQNHREEFYPQINANARIIFVYRNPFDFVASMYKHFQHHKSNIEEEELDLNHFIDSILPQYMKSYISHREMQKHFPGSVKLVPYERLINDRRSLLREILTFLGRNVALEDEVAFQEALKITEPNNLRELELFWGETLARDQSTDVHKTSHMRGGNIGKFTSVLNSSQVEVIIDHIQRFDVPLFEGEDSLINWEEKSEFIFLVHRLISNTNSYSARNSKDAGIVDQLQMSLELRGQDDRLHEISSSRIQNSSEKGESGIYEHFYGRPDEEWIEIIVRSASQPIIEGIQLPGFPDPELQRNMVGSSGETAIREAADFYRLVKKYFDKYEISLAPNGRVLDFGCGFGRHLRFFLKDLPPNNIIGVDIDEEFIGICRETIPMARFMVSEVLPPLEFPGRHFNLIIAFSVFSHLNEETSTSWINEFARLVEPGGIVMLTTHRRDFIEFCATLRREPERIQDRSWLKVLSEHAFIHTEQSLRDYDEGNFVFAVTGGGGIRTPDFYGEAVISPDYVKAHWLEHFEFIDFIDDPEQLSQALLVFKKKSATGNKS